VTDLERLQLLERRIKELVPSFEVRFKDESPFMKTLGKVLFFTKGFMTDFITAIGTKVYFPNREKYLANPANSFRVLAHEFVHVIDFVQNPIGFVSGYLFPQDLALLSLFALFSFLSPHFLLCLLFLLCLAPIPSTSRKNSEIRGGGMSLKILQWRGESAERLQWWVGHIAANFVNSNYWYMYPFRDKVEKELTNWLASDDCLADRNVAYMEVRNIMRVQ
jgi:hypothetical protein